jgi:DNA primase
LVLPKGIKDMGKAHKRYLVKRGFDPDEIARLWHVQGIGIASRLQWRLFIPVILDGETVSWTTRALTDEVELRYIAAKPDEEKMALPTLLYGMDYVRHIIAIHEGPTDVWRMGPGTVCTMGSKFSKAQVAAIAKIPKRIICFDNDPKAQRRARELCSRLEVFEGETLRVELDAPDPGSASAKEVRAFRRLLK